MRNTLFTIAAAAMTMATMTTAHADEIDKKTIITVNETILIPGRTLPPGKYVMKLANVRRIFCGPLLCGTHGSPADRRPTQYACPPAAQRSAASAILNGLILGLLFLLPALRSLRRWDDAHRPRVP